MRLLLAVSLVALALAGCLASDEDPDDVLIEPQPGPPEVLGPVVGFDAPVSFPLPAGGQGLWVHKGILYSTTGNALLLADVADPAAPVALGSITGFNARDVDILEWQGRTYAAVAGSGAGMHIVDVTDPDAPEIVSTLQLPSAGVHNLAAVPGTPYIYSSGASGLKRAIDVLDITDPANPVAHTFAIPARMNGVQVGSDGCHDITVRVDLARAYCAGGGGQYMSGGGETFIWNITDPLEPEWVAMIDDPRLIYHHQAFVNADASILIINDEFIAPNCISFDLPAPAAAEPKVPFAAAWIYDVSDEKNPRQMSHVQNPALVEEPGPYANCGSHFGDLLPDQDKFVMGWYGGGTLLVDFSEPAEPVILDRLPASGSTWDARYHEGHVYHSSNDVLITPLMLAS
jgi:hypothetical protein